MLTELFNEYDESDCRDEASQQCSTKHSIEKSKTKEAKQESNQSDFEAISEQENGKSYFSTLTTPLDLHYNTSYTDTHVRKSFQRVMFIRH